MGAKAKGVPLNVARYLMGHEDVRVTSAIYTHTDDAVIRAAADKINGVAAKATNPDKQTDQAPPAVQNLSEEFTTDLRRRKAV